MANILRFVILGEDKGGPAFAQFTKQVELANKSVDRNNAALKRQSATVKDARGGIAALAGEITGFGAAADAAGSGGNKFKLALAGINLASGVLEPALAGVVVAAGGLAAAFAAAGAGAAAYGAALKPLLSQAQGVMKAQDALDKARATAQANYTAAVKSGASAKTADAARTKAMTAAQDKYNIAVKGTPGPVREFAKSVAGAKTTYTAWADSLAKPVLAPLSGMLKLVRPALTAITPLVRVAAGAFGTLVRELSAKVSAGGLTSVVSTLLPHVRTTILDLGHATGNVVAGIWGILKAFLPVSGQITGGVVKLTAKFREWGQSLSGGTGFQSLMTTFRTETPQAVAILRNLGTVIGNVGKAMFGLSTFSNSRMLLNILTPLSGVMASLSKNTDLVRVAMYALLAVKIGQQFTWIRGATRALVLFSGAAKGATVAQVIAAAATRAWGLAMMALPWVALAAAVVAVAVLIIKYHRQIWAFVQRVWHDILAVIMGVWNWIRRNWPLLLAILTGPIGVAALLIIRHWNSILAALKVVLKTIQSVWNTVWGTLRNAFRLFVVNGILGPLGLIVHGAAAAFGWVPGLGGKLKGAAKAFDTFRASVNKSLGGINGRTVNVGVNMMPTSGKNRNNPSGYALKAAGGLIWAGTGPTADDVPILASRGELIVPAYMVKAGAVDHLRGRLPGFASGGAVGVNVAPHTPSGAQVESSLMASVTTLATAFAKAAQAAQATSGVSGAGPVGGDAGANKALARSMFPWPASQWPAFNTLEMHEAGYNRFARNPSGAYGIPQALPPTKMPFAAQAGGGSHAGPQLSWMYSYIRQRYGTPGNAWAQYYAHPGGVGWYAKGGLVPGYASGGTVGKQGAAYLKAWRTRHGGGPGAAWGPVVLNEQIARSAAAAGRAQALAGASGLSPRQHRFWAGAAAGEKRRLGVLRKELTTERAWRFQLGVGELGLDRQIRAAGNLPGLAGPVRGWKAQLARDKATVAAISRMLGYTDAHNAAWAKAHPAAKTANDPFPTIPHMSLAADRIYAAWYKRHPGVVRKFDSGGTLAPGLNLAWNATGAPEPLVPAGRSGGNTYHITVNVPPTASKADTGRAVVECIREYERGSGTRWRR